MKLKTGLWVELIEVTYGSGPTHTFERMKHVHFDFKPYDDFWTTTRWVLSSKAEQAAFNRSTLGQYQQDLPIWQLYLDCPA